MVNKALEKNKGKGMLLQIRLLDDKNGSKIGGSKWKVWAQKYPTVFGEISDLSLQRDHDH